MTNPGKADLRAAKAISFTISSTKDQTVTALKQSAAATLQTAKASRYGISQFHRSGGIACCLCDRPCRKIQLNNVAGSYRGAWSAFADGKGYLDAAFQMLSLVRFTLDRKMRNREW